MYIDNSDRTTQDMPFPEGNAYAKALSDPRYEADNAEGRAYRAEVNQKLIDSPCIVPSPGEEQKREEWRKRDGAQ
jgi:hypothetical protein